MNWEKFWDNSATQSKDEIAQVQRKNSDSIQLTINNIVDNIKIESTDDILDVCCGNGLITSRLSNKCKSIIGIDLSNELIKSAKNSHPKIRFDKGSATELCSIYDKNQFDKIYLQFSFQYFDQPKMGKKVIGEMLKVLKPNGLIFIGDIPNHQKVWNYYNSLAKRFFYITSKIRGKNRMGKFWKKEELDAICEKLNVEGKFINQQKELPYSHYRFDYLIEKKNT